MDTKNKVVNVRVVNAKRKGRAKARGKVKETEKEKKSKAKQRQKQRQEVNINLSAGSSGGGGYIPMPPGPAFDYNVLANLIRPANTVDMPIREAPPSVMNPVQVRAAEQESIRPSPIEMATQTATRPPYTIEMTTQPGLSPLTMEMSNLRPSPIETQIELRPSLMRTQPELRPSLMINQPELRPSLMINQPELRPSSIETQTELRPALMITQPATTFQAPVGVPSRKSRKKISAGSGTESSDFMQSDTEAPISPRSDKGSPRSDKGKPRGSYKAKAVAEGRNIQNAFVISALEKSEAKPVERFFGFSNPRPVVKREESTEQMLERFRNEPPNSRPF